jgi:dihydroorotate dehydrogenase electron transfer subunit
MKLSAYHIEANRIRTTRILSAKNESQTVKTFTFKDRLCAKAEPGQFLMLWIPGIDEIPLSVLNTKENDMVSVTVKKVGEATKALHNKKVGDVIGVRGPFGNSFTFKEGKILMVGGGTGLVPLLFLAKKIASEAAKLVFLMGAKSQGELLFMDQLKQTLVKEKTSLIATTEDGSYGIKGMATAPLESLLTKERFDMIYTCGPEKMIRKVFDTAEKHGVTLEASLERLMRCAIGLCGSCVIGKYRVCRDGPVFTATQLRKVKNEFGISTRGFDGRKVPLE